MRELLILSASTNAALFDIFCKQVGKSTLVDTLQTYRDQSFCGLDLIDFLCDMTKVARPKTALGYLEHMVDGSPSLRALFRYVQKHHLGPKPDGKLLICEDVPMSALFWDWALNMILFPTTIFHAGLDSAARAQLMKEFNGEKATDLRAMGLLFGVSAEGLNFQQDCHRVIITTPALNQGTELQGSCCPIRVSLASHSYQKIVLTSLHQANQKKPVYVTKLHHKDSVHTYREFRKCDKISIELSTRISDPSTSSLLVYLPNAFQEEVQAVQADPANKPIVDKYRAAKKIKEETELLAKDSKVVPDALDLDQDNVDERRCSR